MSIYENRAKFLAFVEQLDFSTVVMDDSAECILGKFGAAHPEVIVLTPEVRRALASHHLHGELLGAYCILAYGWEAIFASSRSVVIPKFFAFSKPNKQDVLDHFRYVWNMPKRDKSDELDTSARGLHTQVSRPREPVLID